MNDPLPNSNDQSYEENFLGHEIFMEPNPDHYRGGFAWSVSKGDCEIDCGIAPTLEEAKADAHRVIKKLIA